MFQMFKKYCNDQCSQRVRSLPGSCRGFWGILGAHVVAVIVAVIVVVLGPLLVVGVINDQWG